MPRQPAASVRHHRHHVLQPVAAQAFYAQEPEQRTQRGRRQPHRPRPKTTRELTNKADHVSCADTGGIHPTIAEHCLQQSACEPDVVTPRPRAHPPRAAQMLIEGRNNFIDRQLITTTTHLLLPSSEPTGHRSVKIMRSFQTSPATRRRQPTPSATDTPPPGHQPHITTGCT